jgi:TolB-like protein
MKKTYCALLILCASVLTSPISYANDIDEMYPAAIFDFVEKGHGLTGVGSKVSSVIFANLVTEPDISLVDREEMDKLLDEATLNLSGMVNTQQATQIGQLSGAKIIVTGTIFEIEDTIMIVAKIIGTETSRVMGASVKGDIGDSIVSLAEDLSDEIVEIIESDSGKLVAKTVSRQDRIAALKKKMNLSSKPSLTINIKEHHINQAEADPAAETEMLAYSTEVGFDVIAKDTKKATRAAILIVGEGFTQFATRKGDIVGVKARLEVKAIDQRTKQVLAVDRQTELVVDLSEMIAAKKALAMASAKIAERMLPKLVGL